MDLKTGIGKTGVALAILIAIAMCVLSLIFKPVEISSIQYGLCFPSPDSWLLEPIWSWIINCLIIGIIAIILWLVNKSYNFIRTTEPAALALFLIMATSCPWFTQSLNTSVLLCLANIVSIGILFTSYSSRNATYQMFILGFVIGIGSMFQYAFLFMTCVFLIWALFMKVLRLKEFLAFIAGIACPYWISLGMGWVALSDIHFPSLTPLFGSIHDYTDFLLLIFAIAIATGMGFIVTLANFMKLYAGNSKINAMNFCIYILGAFSVICILVDFDNMLAYVITLFMACAVQLANICAVWNPRMPWLVTFIPSVVYIAIFVCSLIF